MDINILHRKIESFRRVMNGETYRRIAKYYGISASRVREDVRYIFRSIIFKNDGLCYERAKDLGLRDILLARKNKKFWINELEKSLLVVDEYVEIEVQLRELLDQQLAKGANVSCLKTIINKIYKDLKNNSNVSNRYD